MPIPKVKICNNCIFLSCISDFFKKYTRNKPSDLRRLKLTVIDTYWGVKSLMPARGSIISNVNYVIFLQSI